MKSSLMVISKDEHVLWQEFVDAKKKAERTCRIEDGIEMKRRLQVFLSYDNDIIAQKLGAL